MDSSKPVLRTTVVSSLYCAVIWELWSSARMLVVEAVSVQYQTVQSSELSVSNLIRIRTILCRK